MQPTLRPRLRFGGRLWLTAESISSFARAAGDPNPIHHDARAAQARGYADVVASGPQTSGLLMGSVAANLTRFGPMLGLDFRFFFRAPVVAGTEAHIEWLVIRVTPKPRAGGLLVELRGRLLTERGTSAVGARGTALVYDMEASSFAGC